MTRSAAYLDGPWCEALGMFGGLKRIAFKLAILAGIPVMGALLLALQIESSARDRARSAQSIGSVEDLAELSARMTDSVKELQAERALAALFLGLYDTRRGETATSSASAALLAQEQQTDAALRAMDEFLSRRDLSRLPPRLGGDLGRARAALQLRAATRQNILDAKSPVSVVLEYYGNIDATLIDATVGLTALSDDGELLRALSSLVAMMRVQECESREHALLSHTFAKGEFAPGLFRLLVTLVTEQAVQVAAFESFATADQVKSYHRVTQSTAAVSSHAMLKKALEASDDDFGIDAEDWFQAQRSNVRELSTLEQGHAQRVIQTASRKLNESRRAVRYSESLAFGVVSLSLLLTVLIGRGITRTVLSLVGVAGRVQREKDYSLRAVKTSADELGLLTDAFNEMLSGIQTRDHELNAHRENLERLVDERTFALTKRNEDMRLVLDTVEQGLVTVDEQGRIARERSRAFDRFFGPAPLNAHFFSHIAGSDQDLAARLELDWSQIAEGILPTEVAIDQAKSRMEIGGRHFALAYKLIIDAERLSGALLTITDVTRETSARRAEAAQREQVQAFTRIMKDRTGFLQFFAEAARLMARIRERDFSSGEERSRLVHTLKGNAALFDVNSVVEAAHALEQRIADGASEDQEHVSALARAWDEFAERVAPVLSDGSAGSTDVSQAELDELLQALNEGRTADLARLVRGLEQEPMRKRFQRVADQLLLFARRLHKAKPQITITGANFRVPVPRLLAFWSAFVHVLRNVADHGLETVEERAHAGKAPQNCVTFNAELEAGTLRLQISDDGRGIDWGKVEERARVRGLPHGSRAELAEAVFAPGLSTSDVVSETSGRGVGMAAVREACRALGGDCQLESEWGRGTTLRVTLALH